MIPRTCNKVCNDSGGSCCFQKSTYYIKKRPSCSYLHTGIDFTDMEALSNDTLLSILEQASQGEGHHMMRAVLPLVCKRWKHTVFSARGKVTSCWVVASPSRNAGLRKRNLNLLLAVQAHLSFALSLWTTILSIISPMGSSVPMGSSLRTGHHHPPSAQWRDGFTRMWRGEISRTPSTCEPLQLTPDTKSPQR